MLIATCRLYADSLPQAMRSLFTCRYTQHVLVAFRYKKVLKKTIPKASKQAHYKGATREDEE